MRKDPMDILLEKMEDADINASAHINLIKSNIKTAANAAKKKRHKEWSRMLILCAPSSRLIICISKAPEVNTVLAKLAPLWRKAVLKREKKLGHEDFQDYTKIWVAVRYRNKKIESWVRIDDNPTHINENKHGSLTRSRNGEEE